ncbi:lytic murein transglycosylase B [Candidatus Sodalis endolongispinus]|uniref:Lytic murein transglycosylase B n=1 Tax=Candidatus Sodalis endolongispinus TaxID=2812662 RepID=A0ABS5YBA2_9GAMM|nr:lytic murein transglycosylase B [Candidatus Sodalis endolongispinus]MBT9432295.1 lytic murein transglycosylase B [Candidatus Sodalis endolongispinus]
MRQLAALVPLIALLASCSSKPSSSDVASQDAPSSGGFLRQTPSSSPRPVLYGDFATNPNVERFIDKMVSEHGFDRQALHNLLAQTQRMDGVLRLMDRQATVAQGPTGPTGAWLRYRQKFITPDNVQNGVAFWNQDALDRAWRQYGVPPEIIVGIICVETRWERVMGRTRIIDALATLAFDYPRRGDYFAAELETFLLMARDEGDDPLALRGSFAGAMGYGQFMPSSFKRYAVDFDGDGHINLWDPQDAIGSVANYFHAHGWVPGGQVAVPANGQAPWLQNGYDTRYTLATLSAAGLSPLAPLGNELQASLLRLDIGTGYQYWYWLPNFYVITRYNHSTQYAMAVWQLGNAVKQARLGG